MKESIDKRKSLVKIKLFKFWMMPTLCMHLFENWNKCNITNITLGFLNFDCDTDSFDNIMNFCIQQKNLKKLKIYYEDWGNEIFEEFLIFASDMKELEYLKIYTKSKD